MIRALVAAALLTAPGLAPAADDPVTTALREAGPGTRFGLVVETLDGETIVALSPDERFVPASTTKLFITAAAFDRLGDMTTSDADGGARVRLEERGGGTDVVLEGRGDARLSGAADCVVDCLSTLADAVAARTRRVRDVVGDDSWFPDERWSLGMGWNNIPTRSGTGISALTLDDNEARIVVRPGARGGAPAIAKGDGYYRIDDRVTTGGDTALSVARRPGERVLRVEGTIAAGAAEQTLRVGVDDPAHRAAWRLAALLRDRGVSVTGAITARHRPPGSSDDPRVRVAAPAARPPEPPALARLVPPPLAADLVLTNKSSQNLHAELLLRRVGRVAGSGSVADGQAAVDALLAQAGIERWRYDLADGSGMSTYNRVSPRATVRLLRWTQAQPWGAAFRDTLPIAGEDGTLARRFTGTPLAGRLHAKTGSLDKASALAGFLTAASGRTLVFAVYANDMPAGTSATAAIDRALLLVAARN